MVQYLSIYLATYIVTVEQQSDFVFCFLAFLKWQICLLVSGCNLEFESRWKSARYTHYFGNLSFQGSFSFVNHGGPLGVNRPALSSDGSKLHFCDIKDFPNDWFFTAFNGNSNKISNRNMVPQISHTSYVLCSFIGTSIKILKLEGKRLINDNKEINTCSCYVPVESPHVGLTPAE